MNKREFKKLLKKKTGCGIQHNGWTCGTCFFTMSDDLNNADWNAVLIYRGDYSLEQINEYRKQRNEEPFTKEFLKERLNIVWNIIKED